MATPYEMGSTAVIALFVVREAFNLVKSKNGNGNDRLMIEMHSMLEEMRRTQSNQPAKPCPNSDCPIFRKAL